MFSRTQSQHWIHKIRWFTISNTRHRAYHFSFLKVSMGIFLQKTEFQSSVWVLSGTCSKKSVRVIATSFWRAARRWWCLVISAVIFLITNCDSACANHILAPSAQNWDNFMDTAFVSAIFLTSGSPL